MLAKIVKCNNQKYLHYAPLTILFKLLAKVPVMKPMD